MFADPQRAEVFNEVYRREQALFEHILTPDLFWQAAKLAGLRILLNPLNLVNLVWLAIAAARNPKLCFASILAAAAKVLTGDEPFSSSDTGQRLQHSRDDNNRKRRRQKAKRKDPQAQGAKRPKDKRKKSARQRAQCEPHKPAGEIVSEAAFSQARQRMPSVFWVALLFVLGQRFEQHHAAVTRWHNFRLLALDGTKILLPDWPALRQHFGTASNGSGAHGAQVRMVLLTCPLARLPVAYTAGPLKVGELTLAKGLLQGMRCDDLILLDSGFLCYGLFWQIAQQASFCVRLQTKINLKTIKQLSDETGDDDVLVRWTPKDSRGQWKELNLPKSMKLRLLTYHAKGFRPLRLLTNVLDGQAVPWRAWWGLSLSEEGEVLCKGAYNQRWEIELSFLEMKEYQGLECGLRSRTAEGIYYEIAGHVLYYLLVRWLLVEAAKKAGVSPLRLSFKGALEEIGTQGQSATVATEQWCKETLLPQLLESLASHEIPERPQREAPRGVQARREAKRKQDAERAKQAAKQAKSKKGKKGKKKKAPAVWFGQGWDLSGPRIQTNKPKDKTSRPHKV